MGFWLSVLGVGVEKGSNPDRVAESPPQAAHGSFSCRVRKSPWCWENFFYIQITKL